MPHTINETSETAKKAVVGEKTEKTDNVQISDKATKQVTVSDKFEKGGKHPENTMKAKIEKLSSFVKELRTTGISSKEISKILKDANRKHNKSIGKKIKQAYTDYKEKKISADDFKNSLYRSANKKVDGITSALQELQAQKITFSANKRGFPSTSTANQEESAVTKTHRESIFAK